MSLHCCSTLVVIPNALGQDSPSPFRLNSRMESRQVAGECLAATESMPVTLVHKACLSDCSAVLVLPLTRVRLGEELTSFLKMFVGQGRNVPF